MMKWSVVALALMSAREIIAQENLNNASVSQFDIWPGFKLAVRGDELSFKFDLDEMFDVGHLKSRTHGHGDEWKKHGSLQKFGSMMMMIPLVMQMLSLPGAIASIKMSLLKSLVVGKLALLLMLFNMLRNQPSNEVVVVHQTTPQHHSYYYPHFHEESEEDDKGWFG